MNHRVRVLLVDDHAVVRHGYRRLLDNDAAIEVVAEAANATEAYQRFCAFDPDVVVMDISLPGASGIEALRRILARQAGARVLVFSMHEDAIFPTRALAAGARGYVTKASAPDVLLEAVHAVAAGKRYLSHDVAQALALRSTAGEERAVRSLAAREFEVLRLLVQGDTLADIAEKLGMTQKTVANHQSAIKQKLGVANSAQLVLLAIRLGVLDTTSTTVRNE
jgi:DNA-binding NarL/FixJ family response regulator